MVGQAHAKDVDGENASNDNTDGTAESFDDVICVANHGGNHQSTQSLQSDDDESDDVNETFSGNI